VNPWDGNHHLGFFEYLGFMNTWDLRMKIKGYDYPSRYLNPWYMG